MNPIKTKKNRTYRSPSSSAVRLSCADRPPPHLAHTAEASLAFGRFALFADKVPILTDRPIKSIAQPIVPVSRTALGALVHSGHRRPSPTVKLRPIVYGRIRDYHKSGTGKSGCQLKSGKREGWIGKQSGSSNKRRGDIVRCLPVSLRQVGENRETRVEVNSHATAAQAPRGAALCALSVLCLHCLPCLSRACRGISEGDSNVWSLLFLP